MLDLKNVLRLAVKGTPFEFEMGVQFRTSNLFLDIMNILHAV